MKRICWMAVGTWLITLGAAAQDNAAMNQAKNTEDRAAMDQAKQQLVRLAAIGPDRFVLTAPVTGAPYSADEVTTFTQTLGDGTHIQREDKVTVYRDSQGRLRRETPTEITISDPVAGVAYSLDPNKLTARKMMVAMKRAVARNAAQGAGLGSEYGGLGPSPSPSSRRHGRANRGVVHCRPRRRWQRSQHIFLRQRRDGVHVRGQDGETIARHAEH